MAPRKQKAKRRKLPKVADFREFLFLAGKQNRAEYGSLSGGNARFLAMIDETGWTDKAKFIKTCLFKREIKYVKLDKAAMDYYMRLTTFHSQFRAIGVNYNQVVKHLKATFLEKTALALLYKLEKTTVELVTAQKQVEGLTKEFEEKHLLK